MTTISTFQYGNNILTNSSGTLTLQPIQNTIQPNSIFISENQTIYNIDLNGNKNYITVNSLKLSQTVGPNQGVVNLHFGPTGTGSGIVDITSTYVLDPATLSWITMASITSAPNLWILNIVTPSPTPSPTPIPIPVPAPSPITPTNCVYSDWSNWGSCFNNIQTRTRTLTSGPTTCVNPDSQQQSCNILPPSPTPSSGNWWNNLPKGAQIAIVGFTVFVIIIIIIIVILALKSK